MLFTIAINMNQNLKRPPWPQASVPELFPSLNRADCGSKKYRFLGFDGSPAAAKAGTICGSAVSADGGCSSML